MRVLSLFDGISCGKLALERAGINIEKYYASEIDKKALIVSNVNHNKINQLGDIRGIKGSDLPEIDLLIGGSPCQGFSSAGKRLNFEDERSNLFFEYARLLDEIKPKYFLLENVKMNNLSRDIITSNVGYNPHLLNSSLVSKQHRLRYYWTNIPIENFIVNESNKFNDYVYIYPHGYIKQEIKFCEYHPTLTKTPPYSKYKVVVNLEKALSVTLKEAWFNEEITRMLTPEECEELQTLPTGYTSSINKVARYNTIGNGWTVDLIAHIFKGMLPN